MRLCSLAILASATTVALALPAWAVQDQPVTVNGVEMVCTGVGSSTDNPAWKAFPVKLTFSNAAGENEADEHVAITQGGKPVLETDCDAPWLLIRAPAGHYDVHASLTGSSRNASAAFTTSGSGAQQTINLAFPGGKQADNSFPAGQSPAQANNQ